jgi:hypothetical protein
MVVSLSREVLKDPSRQGNHFDTSFVYYLAIPVTKRVVNIEANIEVWLPCSIFGAAYGFAVDAATA